MCFSRISDEIPLFFYLARALYPSTITPPILIVGAFTVIDLLLEELAEQLGDMKGSKCFNLADPMMYVLDGGVFITFVCLLVLSDKFEFSWNRLGTYW